jgi:hypothetical protein
LLQYFFSLRMAFIRALNRLPQAGQVRHSRAVSKGLAIGRALQLSPVRVFGIGPPSAGLPLLLSLLAAFLPVR